LSYNVKKKCCKAGQVTDEYFGPCVLHAGYLSLQTHTENM